MARFSVLDQVGRRPLQRLDLVAKPLADQLG